LWLSGNRKLQIVAWLNGWAVVHVILHTLDIPCTCVLNALALDLNAFLWDQDYHRLDGQVNRPGKLQLAVVGQRLLVHYRVIAGARANRYGVAKTIGGLYVSIA
jgi:hypothetical protein